MVKSVRHGRICKKRFSGSVWKYWYYLEIQEISDTHYVSKKVLDTLYMARYNETTVKLIPYGEKGENYAEKDF